MLSLGSKSEGGKRPAPHDSLALGVIIVDPSAAGAIRAATVWRAMDRSLLEKTLAHRGEPAYRAHQVWEWAVAGASSYAEMTNLPKGLRVELEKSVPISSIELLRRQTSTDGTVKALFQTSDGHVLETVLMRFRDGRRSVCLSSQSGCALTCRFCATGAMKLARNLSASEILDQALYFRREGELSHCVFMGMGEPMFNYENVIAASRRLPDLGIGYRRTTISTIGWLPGLQRFTDAVGDPIRLAISLHAPEDSLRSELMPINDRFPIGAVLDECRRYFDRRRRKVFVEYVMLSGINDRPAHARALGELLEPGIYKVNLIPYNPTGAFKAATREAIDVFEEILRRARIPVTVRLTRGRDIAAACGQLAGRNSEPHQADGLPAEQRP